MLFAGYLLTATGSHYRVRRSFRNALLELRAVWAQAARVEAMRAARRAAVAEANGEATDDETRRRRRRRTSCRWAAFEPRRLSPRCCCLLAAAVRSLLSAERETGP